MEEEIQQQAPILSAIPVVPKKEMVVSVPQAMKHYFHELVAGGAFVISSTGVALLMLYFVMALGSPDFLRFLYFLVIAIALVIMLVGFRIIMESEQERQLAVNFKEREWVMNDEAVIISLAIIEGGERGTLRKLKNGAVWLAWGDIDHILLKPATPMPKAVPARMEIHIRDHEVLAPGTIIIVPRAYLQAQEKLILDYCRDHGIKIEGAY